MIYRAFISTLLIYEMDCLTVDMKGLKAPETMKCLRHLHSHALFLRSDQHRSNARPFISVVLGKVLKNV